LPSVDWYDCPIILPYYGGKYEMSRKLVPLLPSHDRYIEVFAGGLSMFFRKHRARWNVLNDIDNNIINLYISVIERYDELIDKLFWIPKSRKLFLNFREEIKEGKEFEIPDPYQAAKYLYCIRFSFNKMIHTPFSMNKDMKKAYDEEFRYSRAKIGGATIENLDFEDLINRYKPAEEDIGNFDPPYFEETNRNDNYMNSLSIEDHYRLKECVDMIDENGGQFMVSYDHRPEVEELYKEYDIRTINIHYSGATGEARKKERKEYVIINYAPISQIGLFKSKEVT